MLDSSLTLPELRSQLYTKTQDFSLHTTEVPSPEAIGGRLAVSHPAMEYLSALSSNGLLR